MLKSNETSLYSPKTQALIQYSLKKWLVQGLWGCLFLFFNFYIYIFNFVSQVLCICTKDDDVYWYSLRFYFFFYCNDSIFFYLIIWWGIGIASKSKLRVLKHNWFGDHSCFYYFSLLCLIILFYYYSNIPYDRVQLQFTNICGYKL
jgi:hypothetical protein